jgi:hypothetical protein
MPSDVSRQVEQLSCKYCTNPIVQSRFLQAIVAMSLRLVHSPPPFWRPREIHFALTDARRAGEWVCDGWNRGQTVHEHPLLVLRPHRPGTGCSPQPSDVQWNFPYTRSRWISLVQRAGARGTQNAEWAAHEGRPTLRGCSTLFGQSFTPEWICKLPLSRSATGL